MISGVICALLSVSLTVISAGDPPSPFGSQCLQGIINNYNESSAIPTYTIDIDAAPMQKWTDLTRHFKNEMKELVDTIKTFTKLIENGTVWAFIDKYIPLLIVKFPAPYNYELLSISTATGVNLGELFVFNMIYELMPLCTTVVAEDDNGQIFHGHNLDFGRWMPWNHISHNWKIAELMRKLLVQITWTRKNKIVYESVGIAGYVGHVAAVRPGKYAVSMNGRHRLPDGGLFGLLQWLLGISGDAKFPTYLLRETMENMESYEDAKQIQEMNGDWNLVQTNTPPGDRDPYLDDRYTPTMSCLKSVTKSQVAFSSIWTVLNSRITKSKQTISTTLMCPTEPHSMQTFVQHCDLTDADAKQECWF